MLWNGFTTDISARKQAENACVTAKRVLKMAELKAVGVSFSLDDFGTAYSSLS